MKNLISKSINRQILITFFVLILVSCTNPVQKDLLNYINNEMPSVAKQETEAMKAYGSVTGTNYKNDATTLMTLRHKVIPIYGEFRKNLESITSKIKTEDVRILHETYIEAVNIQSSAFVLLVDAIIKQDYQSLAQANEKLDKARKIIRDWQAELNDLCKKNNVIYPTIAH